MKQKLLLFILFNFLTSICLLAQNASTYVFSTGTSSTLDPMTGATIISPADRDDGISALQTLPFTFVYEGSNYTEISVSCDGFLKLGSPIASAQFSNSITSTTNRPKLFPLWDDLALGSIGGGGSISVLTTGTAPDRIYKIQWFLTSPRSTGGNANSTFQCWLYETSNNIEFRYGNGGNPGSSSLGINSIAANATNFQSITASAHTASTTTANNSNATWPGNGRFYLFTPPPVCSGTPSPGNTVASVNTACSGVNFNLSLQNQTIGLGVTYLWQSANDQTFTTNVVNLGTNATQTTSQTSPKYYRCQVTCNGNTGISTPLLVGMNTGYVCYCTAGANSTSFEKISNINFNTINNTSSSTAGFENFTNISTTVTIGSSYPFTGTISNGFSPDEIIVWIDFNGDGDFTDMGEEVYYSPAGVGPHSGTITIPEGTLPVNTILRIRLHDSSDGPNVTPCGNSSYGQVEDYSINIIEVPQCAGTPEPGNTLSSAPAVCEGGQVTLSLQNIFDIEGISYQWYDDNGLIEEATEPTYVVNINSENTFYCEVLCSNSNLSAESTPITIGLALPDGGELSGPSVALPSVFYNFTTIGSEGSVQWQYSNTVIEGPYLNVPLPTANDTTLVASFSGLGTFYLRVVASYPGCEDYSDTLTVVSTIPNDNVCGAFELTTGQNGLYSNIGATVEAEEVAPPGGNCGSQTTWCNNTLSSTVWFKFTPQAKGKYSFALSPTLFDSQFALWSVEDCEVFSSFTLLAANDDISGSPYNSEITFVCLDPNTTYYLQVDAFSNPAANWGILVTEELAQTYYADADLDTYGDAVSSVVECDQPEGYEPNNSDCDDSNPDINPEATEECDYVDNDCDESIDEGTLLTFYVDADNDSYGNSEFDTLDCSAPLGYVANDDDCNDTDMTINPQAAEQCDEVDNNCNGDIDEGCGCTDKLAHNYDPAATIDDGSCETCTDGILNGDEVNVDCGGALCATCPPPTAVCGNIITVYTGGGAADYNGPGASDIWNIDAEDFDGGSIVYGSLSNQQVKRKNTNIAFNWTTNGACLDVTPNGVYNNNDKGLVWRDCLPVAPADFNKIRNFEMTITDQFGTSACEGRYIVIHSAPPGGTAPVNINYDQALAEVLDNDEDLSVYPNPGIDQIFIKTNYNDDIEKSVIITDITGRQVLKINKLDSSLINIDTQSLSLGTYTITLNSANGTKSIKWLKVQ